MEDAFLDSYWESQFEVPFVDPWVAEGEVFLSQWD